MADVYAANWTEDDASNNTAAPDGAPEGMAPSGVNNVLRAHQGAFKRYVDQQIPKTTGGTSTAFTLSYTVTPGALVDGMTHLVQFNAVNGASPTLNVNSLGAVPLHFYCGGTWAVLPANMLAVDQIVRVTYNSSAGTYRCIELPPILRQSVSAAAGVTFTGIPANVNNLSIKLAGTIATNGTTLVLQTYDAAGNLDSGASDYAYVTNITQSTTVAGGTAASTNAIGLSSGLLNTNPIAADINANNIQAAQPTQFNYQSQYNDSSSGNLILLLGGGQRFEADRITGFRIVPGIGTFTGRVTVVLS